METVHFVLVGLGNLGRRFCELLAVKAPLLRQQYALELILVGAADSGGAVYRPAGLDLQQVVACKRAGESVLCYPAGEDATLVRFSAAGDLMATARADLLLEASPVNLEQGGEPGLGCIRTALRREMHVVTPNKGPLVLAFDELHQLADQQGVEIRFDGTVAGGLPAIAIGQRDLRGAVVERLEAVPNLVTGYVMDLLAEGVPWDEALARAYSEGVLEGDGSWDLDGWDAAAKLMILVNSVMGLPVRLEQVSRTGIKTISPRALRNSRMAGERVRLVARAEKGDDGALSLSVAPISLPADHLLGRLGSKQMGVVYQTDIYGTIAAIIEEPSPLPSAATMLRDILGIFR